MKSRTLKEKFYFVSANGEKQKNTFETTALEKIYVVIFLRFLLNYFIERKVFNCGGEKSRELIHSFYTSSAADTPEEPGG